MRTYQDLLESLASRPDAPGQAFDDGAGRLARNTHEMLARARGRGAALRALGLEKGDRVGLVVSDPSAFLPLIHGCLHSGLVAVPLPPPPRFTRTTSYRATLNRILSTAGVRLLVVDDEERAIEGVPVERIVPVSALAEAESTPPRVHEDDLALLQFTSGSEGPPKGVRITHRALLANCRAIMVDGLAADSADRGVSWLPLHHDMGLIGFGLAPLLTRTPVTFIPTSRFVRSPAIWLRTLAEGRATITFAPNFAYALVTRRVDPTGLDLSSVRMWGCGAEPVSETTLVAFEQRFAECGVKPGQVSPCYGLAEATLAVTFTPPAGERVVEVIDARAFELEGRAEPARDGRTLCYVSCGSPLANHTVKVVDEAGSPLPDGSRGEIVVKSPSLGEGYFELPSESARVFRPEGLYTGDVGYLRGGQLFLTGRSKDTIIVNGRNYDPAVIEAVATAVDGVRLAAAVNVPGDDGEALGVLVERRGDDEVIRARVRAQVLAELGLDARVVCLDVGQLPRTTSGKLRRAAARALCDPEPG